MNRWADWLRLGLVAGLAWSAVGLRAATPVWRSVLYPEAWRPPQEAGTARFDDADLLQDYSYAGYHRGEVDLPTVAGPVFDVVADFGADATGAADATAAIQAAIAAAQAAGGGVVWLPAGTYSVSRPSGKSACLEVTASHVVLRGAGSDRTFVRNTTTDMRSARIVRFQPNGGGSWSTQGGSPTVLTRDEFGPTKAVQVADVSGFAAGDWVVLHNPATVDWVNDVHMGPGSDGVDWIPDVAAIRGPRYLRQIAAVDAVTRELLLDAPIRWRLLRRDGARVYRAPSHLTEVGIEHLSIGNRRIDGTGWGEEDYTDPTKAAYAAHDSFAIELRGVVDGWVRDVHSYNPGNADEIHLLSNGVLLTWSRGVTVRDVKMGYDQYGGGGGNGYGIRLNSSNECLLMDCETGFMRHGVVFWYVETSGNVVTSCYDHDSGVQAGDGVRQATSGRGSDHHGVFSHSNLIDACRVARSYFETAYRGDWGGSPDHGMTAAQSLIWNLTGEAYFPGASFVVHTEQLGVGHVIGTQGAATGVNTAANRPGSASRTDPVDVVEGEGAAAGLLPQSLYRDQLTRRIGARANWLVNPLTITRQPDSVTVAPGATAVLSVAAQAERANVGAVDWQWWHDGAPVDGGQAATLAIDSAGPHDAGHYVARALTATGVSAESRGAEVVVATPEPGMLVNESVLTRVTAAASLTVGFTLEGPGQGVLLRGVGPSLAPYLGGAGALPRPHLRFYTIQQGESALTAENHGWAIDPTIATVAARVGAFPYTTEVDTAWLKATLPAGNYSAVLAAGEPDHAAGTGLLEAYLTAPERRSDGRLVNLSALRRLDDQSPALAAGFALSGNVPRRLLLRAVGPSLAPYVAGDFLADPVLRVTRVVGAPLGLVVENDDWQTEGDWAETAQAATRTGAFPLQANGADAAIALTLTPGNYSVEVQRKGHATGLALVEVYEVP